jgi:hypothetical protein
MEGTPFEIRKEMDGGVKFYVTHSYYERFEAFMTKILPGEQLRQC